MKITSMCAYALVLAMAAFTITGCSSSGGDDAPAQQIAQLTVEKYPVTGLITDPDGVPVSGTVTLSAVDTNGVAVKLYSDKTGGTQLTTVSVPGVISFFVADTAALPVTVTAVAKATGRVSSSSRFTITASGTSTFTIKLVDTSSTTTAGVVSAAVTGTANSATGLAAPLTTTVAATDPSKTSASVAIPTATVLKDSNNVPLSGTVTTTVTTFAPPTETYPVFDPNIFDLSYYDPEQGIYATDTSSALEIFPGGLGNVQGDAGKGYFVTAGFIAVDVTDATGKQAKTSGGTDFTIRMNIPAGTFNPITDTTVAAGDSIPVWTYNETEAKWKAEVDSSNIQITRVVQQDANGLFVTHTTNHFSFWNLGWLVGTTCTATMNLLNDAITMPLTLKATFTKGGGGKGGGLLLTGFKPAGDASVTATNVPATKNIDLVLIDSNKKIVASKKNFNWCTIAKPVSLSYKAPLDKKPVPVTVTVTEYCAQAPTVTRPVPSATTYATKSGSAIPVSTGTTDAAGSFIHNLTAGTYNFFAYNRTTATYSTKSNVQVVVATPQTVAFSTPVQCTVVTGTTGGSAIYGF